MITAGLLTPSEVAAYRERVTHGRTAPPSKPVHCERVVEATRARDALLREARAPARTAKGKARHGSKGGVDIDAAIARAHARDLERAQVTPERLWTGAMKRAVECAVEKRRSRGIAGT